MKEDWEALIEVLGDTIKKLDTKEVEPVKLGILEFVSTAAMLGLQDLADVSKGFETFLLQIVAPDWDAEAVATLSFSMGALVEKMQLQEYGPKFSSGLSEITVYLELYDPNEQHAQDQATNKAPADEAAMQKDAEEPNPTFDIDNDDFTDLFSDTHLLDNPPTDISEQPFEAEEGNPPGAEPQAAPDGEVEEMFGQSDVDALFDQQSDSPPLPSPAGDKTVQTQAEPIRDDLSEPPPDRPRRDMGFVMDRVDWYKQILRNDPTSLAFVSLAEELCFRAQWREAVETCRKGLSIHPYLTRARVLMGWALWELGKAEEAERTLTEARSDIEVNAVLYKILGEIARSRGDETRAQSCLNTFQSLAPEGSEEILTRYEPRTFEEDPKTGPPPIAEFLSALLRKFEARRKPKTPAGQSLFSMADRQRLKEWVMDNHR